MNTLINIHCMNTRSKTKLMNEDKLSLLNISDSSSDSSNSSIDDNGNLKNFIDDSEIDKKNDKKALKELNDLIHKTPKKRNKNKNGNVLNDIFLSYIITKATQQSNKKLKKKHKKKKIKIEECDSNSDNESTISTISGPDISNLINKEIKIEEINDEESEDDGEYDEGFEEDKESENDEESGSESEEGESSDEEYSFEYDSLDEEYEELLDKHTSINTEEHDMEYFHNLDKEKRKSLISQTQEIYKMNDSNIPLRFKIIESHMDMKTKAIAMENIDKLSEMDVSTGEYSKLDHWINGLLKIPFGKYKNLTIQPDTPIQDKRLFIQNSYQTLNKAIYGHNEAKTHILQVIGKWIKNPESGGNVLAIQGPMGNGKTTLVKDGISKVLDRPFAFIALGGASDSAFFDGHCYTYEGSHWGRIVQILQDSKCMNPVFYFDELDKISETQKGDEIIHMLTHLTDSSQNSLFQDNYFPGINLDLSKCLFIFSYNDESKVNKILKDRMYVIHTKGFKSDDKLKICREYLLPEIYDTFMFEDKDILFTDDILKNIILNYTSNEEGVRNLKRCIETIISKINIHVLSDGDKDLSFKLENFNLPIELNRDHIEILLKTNIKNDSPPFGMYN